MAITLTVTAMSMADLDIQIQDIARRFPTDTAIEAAAVDASAARSLSGAAEGAKAGAKSGARPRGRPRGLVEDLSAAKNQGAAGAVQAHVGDAVGGEPQSGDVGDPAVGDAGAVEPEAAAKAEVEALEDDPFAQAVAQGEDGQAGSTAGAADDGVVAGAPAEDAQDLAGDAEGAGAVGAGALTIEDVKAAAKEVIRAKGMKAVEDVFKKHGIAKPGATPPEKFDAVVADLRRAVG